MVGGATAEESARLVQVQGSRLSEPETWVAGALVLMALVAVIGFVARPRAMVSILAVTLLPVVVVYFYSHFRTPIFSEGAFAASAVMVPLLIGAALTWRYTAMLGWLLTIAMLCLSIVSIYAFEKRHEQEQWRDAFSSLQSLPGENRRLVVFLPAEGQLVFDYYAHRTAGPPPWTQATGAPTGIFDTTPPRLGARIDEIRDLQPMRRVIAMGRFNEAVLVLSREELVDPEGLVERYFRREWGAPQTQSFGGVTVQRYTRKLQPVIIIQ